MSDRKNVLVMVSPVSAPRLSGIARFAKEYGWHLMIQDRLGHHPLAWNGDGVIATLRSDRASFDAVKELIDRGIPIVDMTIARPDVDVARVTSDHTGIGRLAGEHFTEREFKNVVWFSIGWGHVHELRYQGLRERYPSAAKWVLSDELPKKQQNDWTAFADWIGGKLKAAPKPLAALTYDEADAARLLNAAERTGVAVPEELAILSIGNDPLICENQSVTLSSVDQNLERGGYEAAALLNELMSRSRRGTAKSSATSTRKRCARVRLVPPMGIAVRQSTDAVAVAHPTVRRALKLIAANLNRPYGAPQLAAELGLTRNRLDKLFTAELGRSVGTETTRLRLARAKLLLREPGMKEREIAASLGYCSPSHFSNAFKAATGRSPSAWRASVTPGPGSAQRPLKASRQA